MKLWRGRNDAQLAENHTRTEVLNPAQLIEVMQSFPISGKVRYSIGHQDDQTFESIIIAYGINNHLVYSQNDIRSHLDGKSHIFLIDDNWKDIVVRDVNSFSLLIPHILEDEEELSYPRRVEMLNEVRFSRGQDITLISLLNDRGVPHLQTQVRKRVVMKGGYYANHPVVILETIPDTLTLVDQRQQRRVRTTIPVRLRKSESGELFECALVDFSESFVRLRVDDDSPFVMSLQLQDELVLSIELERQPRRFTMQGRVTRIDNEFIVMELLTLMHEGRFEPISMLDVFEFKATLLQHPETQ